MILDAQLQFADGQTLSGDAPSTNTIDFGDAPRDMGVGERLYVLVVVDADITGTLQVNLEVDDNDAFSSAKIIDLGSFAAAAVAGSRLLFSLGVEQLDERYARLDFNGATAGDVSAFVAKDIDAVKAYPRGYTITLC